MAQKKTSRSASKKTTKRKGSSSAASEYVREEMHEQKKGRFKSPKQAIAVGLSMARRAGEDVPPPKKGKTSAATRKKAESDYKAGQKRAAKQSSGSASKSSGRKTTAKKQATKKTAAKKKTAKRSR